MIGKWFFEEGGRERRKVVIPKFFSGDFSLTFPAVATEPTDVAGFVSFGETECLALAIGICVVDHFFDVSWSGDYGLPETEAIKLFPEGERSLFG